MCVWQKDERNRGFTTYHDAARRHKEDTTVSRSVNREMRTFKAGMWFRMATLVTEAAAGRGRVAIW